MIGRKSLSLFLFLLVMGPLTVRSQVDAQPAPLFDDPGDHHFSITTDSERAQQYIDQRLILHYGFNHAEAVRS